MQGRGNQLFKTRSVDLNVQLPADVAAQARELQRTSPDLLSMIVLHGMTCRTVYRRLETPSAGETGGAEAPGR